MTGISISKLGNVRQVPIANRSTTLGFGTGTSQISGLLQASRTTSAKTQPDYPQDSAKVKRR